MTLRTRVALAAAVPTAVVVVCFAVVGLWSADSEIHDEVDAQLDEQARVAVAVVAEVADGPIGPAPADDRSLDLRVRGTAARLLTDRGAVISEGPYPEVPVTGRDRTVARTQGEAVTRDETVGDNLYRVVTQPAGSLLGAPVAIQVARPIDDIEQSLDNLTLIFLVLGIVGTLVAMLLGWLISRSAVGPVARLGRITAHIAETEDLAIEIPEGGGAEITNLARSFNRMLATLRASRLQQRRLVADASHELRTPITSLRTNIEVLADGRELSDDEHDDLLADVKAQLQELSDLVANLVELSRADESTLDEYVDVRLDEVTRSALARVRRRARTGVQFDVNLQPRVVRGQASLLERAVLNVLDNAVKWNPPGGTITVVLDDHALTVTDEGPGIAARDRERVFERFWRAPDARAQPGSGLGLAIVSQIVTAHGGAIVAEEAPAGGARIVITLPTTGPERSVDANPKTALRST